MALSKTHHVPASQFNSGGTANVTGCAWSAGDKIIVFQWTNNTSVTLSAPTNANLTFTAVAAATIDTGTSESNFYTWEADAGSSQTGQTIVFNRSSGSGVHGGIVHVITGGPSGTANADVNRTESAFSKTVSANSIVLYGAADWNGVAAGRTIETGTGTATERVDDSDGTNYACWSGDWVGTSAGTFNFGVTSYTSWKVTHAVIEVLDGGGGGSVTAQVATLALAGVAGSVAGGPSTVAAQVATLSLSGRAGSPSLPGGDGLNLQDGTSLLLQDGSGLLLQGSTGGGSPQTVTAQVATLTLSGVAATPSGGPTTRAAQVASITLAGVDGASSGGPATVSAQVATVTLAGIAGSPSISGASPQTVTAQVATIVLSGVQATPVPGPVSKAAQVASLTLTGVAGTPTPGAVTIPAQVGTMTLLGSPGTVTGGATTRAAQVATLTLSGVPGSPSTPSSASVAAQVVILALVGVPGVMTVGTLPTPKITPLSARTAARRGHPTNSPSRSFLARR